MIDYENQRKLVVVFILAVILTVIFTIIALVFIWIPDNKEVEQKFEVGKIERPDSSEQAVVENYYKQLYILFLNKDLDAIYDLVGKDYLEYYKYDKQQLLNMLEEKNVFSRGLELVQYKTYVLQGYNNIYEFDLKVKNEAYSINVVLREKSPNNYTVAFDGFIDYDKSTYTATLNSIKLDIAERIRYTNSVQYEFKLTNNYNKTVKINEGGTGNPVILVNSSGASKRPIMSTLNAAEITIYSKETRNFTVVFDIEDTYDYVTYNMLVLKNSQFEGMQGSSNLEFTLK